MNKIIKLGLLSLVLLLSVACSKEANLQQGTNDEGVKPYIVVFKSNPMIAGASVSSKAVVANAVSALGSRYSVKATKQFSRTIQAAVFHLDSAKLQEMQLDPDIAFIEEDKIISIGAVQEDPEWGLDRIDQQTKSLDKQYRHNEGSTSVNAYIIDTGIRISHEEFEGRAVHGIDTVSDDSDASDCNGHGTHVAGTVGGKTYGVAKNVKLIGVRVLDCRGSGRTSDVIEGIEWVTNNHVKPAVANLSLGGGKSESLDAAVRASIESGVIYAIAAGNSSRDACNYSPARVASGITVGASTDKDKIASFSNDGSCVDIIAPGEDIRSASHSSDSRSVEFDGTSMATPHVAGAIAILLSHAPDMTPSEVKEKVISESVEGALSGLDSSTPNRLLNTEFLLSDGGDDGGSGEEPVDGPIVLRSGEEVSIASVERHEEIHLKIDIPESTKEVSVEMKGSSGDADLYVKQGSRPDTSSYDCRPYRSGSDETCELEDVPSGELHIVVRGYSKAEGIKIKASIVVEEETEGPGSIHDIPAPCDSCEEYIGSVDSKGDSNYHPNGSYYYQRRSKTHKVWLKSLGNNNLDVELYKWKSSRWVKVKSSTKSGSDEYLSYRGSSGYYTVKVISKSGGGEYKVWHIGK